MRLLRPISYTLANHLTSATRTRIFIFRQIYRRFTDPVVDLSY
ncbi:MAG: hypothetical protein CM15mP51_22220 [Porticoccaceae bacterium]|nr:MAG: hypothetical protein CM15mP51_22220 [Porticoccaceae bacterium]